MTADELIHLAVAQGATGITFWPCAGGWQAGVRSQDGGYAIGVDPDPVAALRKALRRDTPTPTVGDLFE